MKIFGGTHKGKKIESPKEGYVRPTSGFLREAVFNICAPDLELVADKENFNYCLDLFAGSGAIGLEALSQGASATTFVESNLYVKKVLRSNIDSLLFENRSHLIVQDALTAVDYLIKTERSFDIIYVDPPYYIRDQEQNSNYSIKILKKIIHSNLLKKGGYLFIEDSKECPIDSVEVASSEFKRKKDRKSGRSVLRHFVRN